MSSKSAAPIRVGTASWERQAAQHPVKALEAFTRLTGVSSGF